MQIPHLDHRAPHVDESGPSADLQIPGQERHAEDPGRGREADAEEPPQFGATLQRPRHRPQVGRPEEAEQRHETGLPQHFGIR